MPYWQSFFHICQIGNHHVSLWMMPHKNSEHCSRLYIDFCFWIHCLKTIPKIFYLRFHNIFIFMVRATVNTPMLGVPWQDCVGLRSCLNFSLHMACVESMAFVLHGKNQRFKDQACNTWSPPHGDVHVHRPRWDHWWFQDTWREMVVESFDNLQTGVVWTRYFWAYYCQFGK